MGTDDKKRGRRVSTVSSAQRVVESKSESDLVVLP